MRVLYLKEKSRSGDRSYRGGVRREVAIGGSWHLWRKSRSGDRSYRGGVRRERSPLGEVGIYGEVAIGRSLLQGRCQERGRHWGKLAFMGKSRSGVATGDRESRHWGKLASGGSRDREIAPTGEVSGESRHWGKLAFMEKVAIGRSLLQGRCQERVAIGGSWHQGEVAIGRSLLQGRCQERGRHWGKLAFMERSRSGDRSYRGGVRRESPLGEVGIYGESRDREIAPTENLTEKRILRYSI